MTPEIRRFLPDDEPALYDICLRTGDSGEDATALHEDPALLGHLYVGPYLSLAPDLAFVAEDEHGVAGYVLGVRDTRIFEHECDRDWWPDLRERYPLTTFPPSGRDAGLVRLMHDPPRAADEVVAEYPAHLHIDLLPRLQGRGYGRRLMDTLFTALRAARVPGVHLGVGLANERATAFYHHLGFTELRRDRWGLTLVQYL
ncbi:hypothetical protein BLA60_32990 [Actinophytocola xinjiangensis]|uniref:N-acetyltransferase domain-containing protein n=1 Tax=Actinophytocola xinjiangensis TaxID=485602 RepID=A0A7Z1AUJ7_9PSEU|nr:GNAT family N-acetyltransferase [Actinophytocola xinjiangensis]OLF06154.1 hypothetical protein BLA60_32990 [Actinophytocola xinjiangensis]